MGAIIYRMSFRRVHFGDGNLNESIGTFTASRLFSALFQEAVKIGVQNDLLEIANQDDFYLSDAFPVIDDDYYLPKPINDSEKTYVTTKQSLRDQKRLKTVKYVTVNQLQGLLKGDLSMENLDGTPDKFFIAESVTKKGNDPYEVGIATLKSDLYVIAQQSDLLDSLMESLSYSGIGGKRSSGYGQFILKKVSVPNEIADKLSVTENDNNRYLLLTTAIPTMDELDEVMNDAKYTLVKSSGFAYSPSANQLLRKQDLFKFSVGSIFNRPFIGEIVDVQPDDFVHPVWNYSKGLFLKLIED